MQNSKSISFIGYASGIAAGDPGCGDGPIVLKNSDLLEHLAKVNIHAVWQDIILPSKKAVLHAVAEICNRLAKHTLELVEKKQMFTVFGGDHSSAIGTWSGVAKACEKQGALGLIWVDAHMDSHTPETSDSGNIHGMPVACLLGYGVPELTHILSNNPKIKPENLCLIGIRSYEPGEAELIKRLGVRFYNMEMVNQLGIEQIMQEAVAHVTKSTTGYGITIDLDGIDPQDAPGVGTPEANGINGKALCNALAKVIRGDKKLIGTEITEFNPHHDRNGITLQLIEQLLKSLIQSEA